MLQKKEELKKVMDEIKKLESELWYRDSK
jgi:hypothetical protein